MLRAGVVSSQRRKLSRKWPITIQKDLEKDGAKQKVMRVENGYIEAVWGEITEGFLVEVTPELGPMKRAE